MNFLKPKSFDPVHLHATKDLAVIHWRDEMARAFQAMTTLNIRHLPVVDDQGGLVGMLSERDVQRAMMPEALNSPTFHAASLVRDYMSWPVEFIEEDRSISDAARLMIEKKISSLVVAKGTTAVGVITTEDLLKALVAEYEGSLRSLKDRLSLAIYDSPIGGLAQNLSNSGV